MEIPPFSQGDVPSRIIRENAEAPPAAAWMMEHRELCPGVHAAQVLFDDEIKDIMVRITNTSSQVIRVDDQELLRVLHSVDIVESAPAEEVTLDSEVNEAVEELLTKVDPSLPLNGKNKLRDTLQEFQDVFSQHTNDLGRSEVTQHHIDTGNARPV